MSTSPAGRGDLPRARTASKARPAPAPGARAGRSAQRATSRPTSTPASPSHTPASKISVTVDAGVLREVRELIRGTGESLSAHVTQALERDLRLRRMEELIGAYEADHGAIGEDEIAQVQAAWQG